MDPRGGVKDYVRLSVFLERHPDRSGGIFVVRDMMSSVRGTETGSPFSYASEVLCLMQGRGEHSG